MLMKRCEVLHVLEASLGGTGRHVIDLLTAFNGDPDFRLTLAYSKVRSDQRFETALQQLPPGSARLIELPMVRQLAPLRDLNAVASLCRLIRREHFDIIHAHSSKAGGLARVAARISLRSVATVYTPHSIAVRLGSRYWLLEKCLACLTDALVAVSPSEKAELTRYHLVPASKVHTITLGIDTDALSKESCAPLQLIPTSSSGTEKPLLVGTVGRLCAQKDPITFVRTAEIVTRQISNVHFVWIGDGELKEAVTREINQRHLSSAVSLIPFRPDIAAVMRSLDVFVLLSQYESFGYVTCEAMAAGLPVVATDTAGSADLVAPDVSGFLVPTGSPAKAAEAVLHLLKDQTLRQTMGQAGRNRAEGSFNMVSMAQQLRTLYRLLLRDRSVG
jgi:glycosyltransferase involved in cell wall biosynthesis